MAEQKHKTGSKRQRGIALLVCIFALVLLSGIGIGLMYMADAETMVNANYRDEQRAYFAAYAGLQEVRERLMIGAGDGLATVPRVVPTSANSTSVVYVMNPKSGESVAPWTLNNSWQDKQLCHEAFPALTGLSDSGTNTPCTTVPTAGSFTSIDSNYKNTAKALSYRWVRVTLKTNNSSAPFYVTGAVDTSTNPKPICWGWDTASGKLEQLPLPSVGYGTHCDDPPTGNDPPLSPVYRLTSLAQAPGGTRRMLQMEVANDPPVWTNAAVDSKEHVSLKGNLLINAFDNCSCDIPSCTTDKTTGITTCPSRSGKSCDNTKWAIYSAAQVDSPNNSETLVAGPNPAYAQNQPWVFDVDGLVNKYKNLGNTVNVVNSPYNYTCTGTAPYASCGNASGPTFGTPPAIMPPTNPDSPGSMTQQITYIPGDFQMNGNGAGAGILVVDGDLKINGGLSFYGLIIVRGVISFTGGGSQQTNIVGAVLAGKQSIDETGTTCAAGQDNCDVLGGSSNIQYDECALKKTTQAGPPTVIMSREINF